MSIDPLWNTSIKKSLSKLFYAIDLGVPWELDQEIEGDKARLIIYGPKFKQKTATVYDATFIVKLVVATAKTGLYDLSDLAGKAANAISGILVIDDICAEAKDDIEIEYFDWADGHKEATIEREFKVELRG